MTGKYPVGLMLIGLLHAGCVYADRVLESYNVDTSGISVSGVSSGAAAAIQLQVAYSSTFMGVGAYAGGVYYCSESSLTQSVQCMRNEDIDPFYYAQETRVFANEGDIDPVADMFGDRVFILHGELDTLVDPGCGDTIEEYYREFTPQENIKLIHFPNLVHGFPTEDYGGECDRMAPLMHYINWCEYHGAYEMLQWVYQDLDRPDSSYPTPGDFYVFDQSEFKPTPGPMSSISMTDTAFMYVPTGCIGKDTACRLHVQLHGCDQGIDDIDDGWVSNSFFHEVAELNNIIVMWPQVATSVANPVNPQGCWDWWGYNDDVVIGSGNYVTHRSEQMRTVMNMVERVVGDSIAQY